MSKINELSAGVVESLQTRCTCPVCGYVYPVESMADYCRTKHDRADA